MKVQPFDISSRKYISQAARLLTECFPQAYADSAEEEMRQILETEKLAFMAEEDKNLLGFVGAIPQYGTTGWELHPLAVSEEHRGRGIGRKLVLALENTAQERGCITMYLGTDDEFGKTSLSNTDLFLDTFKKIESIKNLNCHPYEFYKKIGYKIVGVIPDANRKCKPYIIMAKSIGVISQ